MRRMQRKNRIYAEAYGEDPDFFQFYRSLDAYRQGLKGSNTTMVVSPDGEFFDFLKSDTGRAAPAAPAVGQ